MRGNILCFLALFFVMFSLIHQFADGEVQSLKADKTRYFQTDKIIFSGKVGVNDTSNQVNLEITGPQGNYIDTFTVIPQVNGSFQIILDTNNTKIKNEFSQSGNYSALAFVKTRSSSSPIVFGYSATPPIPDRNLLIHAGIIKSHNRTQVAEGQTKEILINQSMSTMSSNQNPSISSKSEMGNASLEIEGSSPITNVSKPIQQNKPVPNPLGQPNCKSPESPQQNGCGPIATNSPVTNGNLQPSPTSSRQTTSSQNAQQETYNYIKGAASIAVISGITYMIIKLERRNQKQSQQKVKEGGPLFGVSYHPRTKDGVRIHARSCYHVAKATQSGSTRWLYINGYQNAKFQAESISASQGTYCKNAQCCLQGIIGRTMALAVLLALIPFFGLLGGLLVRDYSPSLGKGLMYFGLTYGILACIWLPH